MLADNLSKITRLIYSLLESIPLDFLQEAVLFGSAAITLNGIDLHREAHDLDFFISTAAWQKLRQNPMIIEQEKHGFQYLAIKDRPEIEFLASYPGVDYETVHLHARPVEGSQGLLVASLEDLSQWKRAQGREKDGQDLRWLDTLPPASAFVTVNGLRLHYLDWGGRGPDLLFLAGLGCNAHIFEHFAPRFTDRFHVLALTRRGHGESDHPGNGYDIDTLTEDLRLFLDALHIDQAILAGHSYAGIELSHFAALHPARVLKLVYLDAAFYRNLPEFKTFKEANPLRKIPIPGLDDPHYSVQDYFACLRRAYPSLAEIWGSALEANILQEVTFQPDGRVKDRMSEAVDNALGETMTHYAPEDSMIQVPTLSFYVFPDASSFISQEYMTADQQAQVVEFFATAQLAWLQKNIQLFRRNMPHARIVEIPHGHHYCFIKDEELVLTEMMKFLLE